MAERMAGAGYRVLLPDLFYRSGPYAPMDPKVVFGDPAKRADLFSRFMSKTTIANVMRDTRAFLAHLGEGKLGITGYCMGGRFSLAAAGTFPDRVAAAAPHQPGDPASDAPHRPPPPPSPLNASVYARGPNGAPQ